MRADRYYYTFRSTDGHSVKVCRGDGAPKATDGMGGWSLVVRPRRTALTQWDGRNPYAMDVPILFDGYGEKQSQEVAISTLFQMSVGSDFEPPPRVKVEGAVPIKGATWVINGIDWGDDVIWSQPGLTPFRLRQDAVVHLLQYKPESRVKILTTKALPNHYTVYKKGETMRSIARSWYGDGSLWTRIKAANPKVRDPNNLKVGLQLRMP